MMTEKGVEVWYEALKWPQLDPGVRKKKMKMSMILDLNIFFQLPLWKTLVYICKVYFLFANKQGS